MLVSEKKRACENNRNYSGRSVQQTTDPRITCAIAAFAAFA